MVELVVLAVCAVVLGGFTVRSMLAQQAQTASDQSIYTSSATTDRTGTKVSAVAGYRSSDNTRAALLFKIDDMSQMPADAKDWVIGVTGADTRMVQETVNGHLTGRFVLYGTTGYGAFVLDNPDGFSNDQVLVLTGRATKSVGQAKNNVQYDQFLLAFNPGAGDTKVAQSLDSADFDDMALYNEVLIWPQEKHQKETLQADLKKLDGDLTTIKEYEDRLVKDNVVVPAEPDDIVGDKVVKGSNGNPVLQTSHVPVNGYNFDWHDGSSVSHSYSQQLDIPAGQSLSAYITAHGAQTTNTTNSDTPAVSYTDGTPVDMSDTTTGVAKEVSDLTGAWNTYITDKTTYCVTDMTALLQLEADYQNVQNSVSINDSNDVLTIY